MNIKVVYEHWDIEADMPFYVGMGDPERSYDRSNRGKLWKSLVKDLEESGFAYEVRIVDSGLTKSEAHKLEKFRIKMWTDLGVVLVNKSKGGEGTSGYRYTDEQKARRSQQLTGKPRPDVTARMLGVPKPKEQIEKIAAKQRGVPKPKVSAALKGRKQPQEVVEKRSQKLRGRKYTKEHCGKISLGRRGKTSKINADQAMEIYLDPRPSLEICSDYGISYQTVRDIKLKRTWTYIHANLMVVHRS